MRTREQEIAALLVLLKQKPKGTTWGEIAFRVSEQGSAYSVLAEESEGALFPPIEETGQVEDSLKVVEKWFSSGYKIATVLDPEYPVQLLGVREAPPFLFYEGDILEKDPGVSIVGSRDSSTAGLRFATEAAEMLVSKGLSVLSGLATGIDTVAHRTALNVGGRTVAFIGTGISRSYPSSNAALQKEVSERGLLLSQFFPEAAPTTQSFPMRNATMSGYGLATIIVEAGEYSGTRIQARVAGRHGRPVILTTQVVENTTWGRELQNQPNVFVVRDIEELASAVGKVQDAPVRLREAVDSLVLM